MADESGKRCEQGFDEAAIDRKTLAKKARDSGDILMYKTLMLNTNMSCILNQTIFQYAASDIRWSLRDVWKKCVQAFGRC